MPITKSAKKTQHSSERKYAFNLRRKRRVNNIIKEIGKLLSAKKVIEAEKKLPEAYKAIDKAAKMGTLHKNTASRRKAGLASQIKRAKK